MRFSEDNKRVCFLHRYPESLVKLKLLTGSRASNPINTYLYSHHCAEKIRIEDEAIFIDPVEYLKRFYEEDEDVTKIRLLSEYYKFHLEAPRVFIPDIEWIMEENYTSKRQVQYAKVTKEINQNHEPEDQGSEIFVGQNLLDELSLSRVTEKSIQGKQQQSTVEGGRTLQRMVSLHKKNFGLGFQPQEGRFISNQTHRDKVHLRKSWDDSQQKENCGRNLNSEVQDLKIVRTEVITSSKMLKHRGLASPKKKTSKQDEISIVQTLIRLQRISQLKNSINLKNESNAQSLSQKLASLCESEYADLELSSKSNSKTTEENSSPESMKSSNQRENQHLGTQAKQSEKQSKSMFKKMILVRKRIK